MKEQIEEMFNIIVDGIIDGEDNNGVPTGNTCADIATALYNAGYRKQKEGEWIVVYEYNDYRMCKEAKIACSVCGHKPKYEGYLSDMNFCPNCGAKMKGGAE